MLTKDQKMRGLDISKYLLSFYEDDTEEFMRLGSITSILRPKSRVYNGSTLANPPPPPCPPMKFKRVSSTGKVMASVFGDNHGIIMVAYLEEVCTINGAYYAEELRGLCQEIVKKKKKVGLR